MVEAKKTTKTFAPNHAADTILGAFAHDQAVFRPLMVSF
jgi:hypothetical protein